MHLVQMMPGAVTHGSICAACSRRELAYTLAGRHWPRRPQYRHVFGFPWPSQHGAFPSAALYCGGCVAYCACLQLLAFTQGPRLHLCHTKSEIRSPWSEQHIVLTWHPALFYGSSSSITRQDPCVLTLTCTNLFPLMKHYVCFVTFESRQ